MAPNVLVVDDDLEIRSLLRRYLAEQGFRVSTAGSRAEFEQAIETGRFDLVILDVTLPDGSGLDICKSLRNRDFNISIILVTARKEEVDRIIGLELGADDYLGKPFSPRELVARMRAVLRRVGDAAALPPTAGYYRFAEFTADAAALTVVGSNGLMELTGAEFQLLKVFLDRPGRVLSRDQLLDLTQGRAASAFDRSIDVLVSRLRRKFREAGMDEIVKTVRNGGYQFAARVERGDSAL